MKSATLIINDKGYASLAGYYDVQGELMSRVFSGPPKKTPSGMVWHGQWMANEYLDELLFFLTGRLDEKKGELWKCVSVDQEDNVFADGNWNDSPLEWRRETRVFLGNEDVEDLFYGTEQEKQQQGEQQ